MLVKGILSSAIFGASPKSQTSAWTCRLCKRTYTIHYPISQLNLHSGRLTHTKDGIPPGCVPTEGEDVGVVSSDHGESVRLSGQLCGSLDSSVEHHCFCQSQLGYAVMVAVINSPPCRKKERISIPYPSKNSFCFLSSRSTVPGSATLNEDSADMILIFYKQEVPFGVLVEDLNSFFCHFHYGGVPRTVPKHFKFHVLWLKQT